MNKFQYFLTSFQFLFRKKTDDYWKNKTYVVGVGYRDPEKLELAKKIADELKIQFQIAYEIGLESLGSYDDFEAEFYRSHGGDREDSIISDIVKHL